MENINEFQKRGREYDITYEEAVNELLNCVKVNQNIKMTLDAAKFKIASGEEKKVTLCP